MPPNDLEPALASPSPPSTRVDYMEGVSVNLDSIEATLADQGQMLREHRHLLEQILAKVA